MMKIWLAILAIFCVVGQLADALAIYYVPSSVFTSITGGSNGDGRLPAGLWQILQSRLDAVLLIDNMGASGITARYFDIRDMASASPNMQSAQGLYRSDYDGIWYRVNVGSVLRTAQIKFGPIQAQIEQHLRPPPSGPVLASGAGGAPRPMQQLTNGVHPNVPMTRAITGRTPQAPPPLLQRRVTAAPPAVRNPTTGPHLRGPPRSNTVAPHVQPYQGAVQTRQPSGPYAANQPMPTAPTFVSLPSVRHAGVIYVPVVQPAMRRRQPRARPGQNEEEEDDDDDEDDNDEDDDDNGNDDDDDEDDDEEDSS